MNESGDEKTQGLEVRSYFARGRNALVARADFGELYVDYYLHLAQFALRPEPAHDLLFKEALAALTLHCASRPRTETIAWTINLQDPLLNIFVTGSNPAGAVAGQVFSDKVRKRDSNLFCSDVVESEESPRRSVVNFNGKGMFSAAEQFYAQSEQRRARYFCVSEEDFVLVVAQPGCDLEWLEALDDGGARKLDADEELSLLEQRYYRWECGCTQERLLQVLAPSHRSDPDSLFGEENVVRISCPRCGARHAITRETLEAFVSRAETEE